MNKNCLNCAYEPDWSGWLGYDKYARKRGRCKWREFHILQTLPKTFKRYEQDIVMYKDNSGVYYDCPCWKEKA